MIVSYNKNKNLITRLIIYTQKKNEKYKCG